MLFTADYALHPRLLVSVSTSRRAYHEYFENEYRLLCTAETSENATRLTVHIVDRLPEATGCDRLRSVQFKTFFRYRYLVRGLGGSNIEIYFEDSHWGALYAKTVTLFLQSQVIEPIAYDALMRQGVYFMHAAGVSDGANGYVLAAHGGTGKTTLTMSLLGEGMAVLGDDLLMIDVDSGIVRPYLRPLHIFTYNVKTLINASIPWSVRAKVRIKDLLRSVLEFMTRHEFLISTRIHAATIFPSFRASPAVPIKRILFLIRDGDDTIINLSPHSTPAVANQILNSSDLNRSLYTNVLEPHEIQQCRERELALIEKVLTWVGEVHFINTRKLDISRLQNFAHWLVS